MWATPRCSAVCCTGFQTAEAPAPLFFAMLTSPNRSGLTPRGRTNRFYPHTVHYHDDGSVRVQNGCRRRQLWSGASLCGSLSHVDLRNDGAVGRQFTEVSEGSVDAAVVIIEFLRINSIHNY